MKVEKKISVVSIGSKKFGMVPVSEMVIDRTYQRVLRARVKRMINNWDYEKCDVLVVSYRDDKFYVVDGQHRYEAAKVRGESYLACQILEGMTQIDEARKFISQNTESSVLTPYDTWNANLLLHDVVDCSVDSACKTFGIEVSMTPGMKKPAVLGSLTTARKIVKGQGRECLMWIFSVLHNAKWDEQQRGHNSTIMRALKIFYVSHKSDLFRYTDRLTCMLHKTTPAILDGRAARTGKKNR